MIDSIIAFSIKNKLIVFLLVLALAGTGLFSLSRLPIDAVPDITNNQVQVITISPTLAAQEVERFITYPVEISMASLPEVLEIRSISRFGLSVITIVFNDGVAILDARQMVSEKLNLAKEQIPPGLGNPELAPVTTGLGEIYQYAFEVKEQYAQKYSITELRSIQDWIVKRQLLGTPGVADISSFGGYVKQYEISVDPDRLKSFDVSMSDIFEALAGNNQNTGGAYIDKKPNAYFIRSIGLIGDLEDIRKIPVKTRNNLPLLIRDVAQVQFGTATRYGALTFNNDGEAVGGIVLMLKGANSKAVIRDVKQKVAEINKTLPPGIKIKPFIDRSKLVDKAIHTVSQNLIEGGLIVIFILVLLLGNLRAGLIIASVIPLSMLFAISLMHLFGISGNLMSLGAIDFGIIVDGAVIIVEAIVHRVSTEAKLGGIQTLTKEQMDKQVLAASVKIRKSAAFGELIILIVYLPILSMAGTEGKMFRPMAQTVIFAILGAFLLSLTYVPMMSALFLSKQINHKEGKADRMLKKLHNRYVPMIVYALKKKALVITSALALLMLAVFLFFRMGGEFIPTLEEGDFAVETLLMPGSSLSQTIETSQKASEILMRKFPEVKEVIGKIGTSEIPTDPMPVESCDLIVTLKEKDEWTSASTREELADKMNVELSVLPGVAFSFQQPIQMRFNELMTGARQDIAIKIYGEDMEVLAKKATEVAGIVGHIKGVGDLFVERVSGLPQIVVEYKRDRIAQYGLKISEVNATLRAAFAGEIAGSVFEGEKKFDLVVRLNQTRRADIEDVRNLYINLPAGNQIPLTQVADISYKSGPMQISRDKTHRKITVGINVRNRDVESLVNEIEKKLGQRLKLDPGYSISYGGQFENLVEAKNRLMVAVPIALLLIFVMLYFTFDSIKDSLLIFTAIPFAAVGGVFLLLLRQMSFSISAGVGFIALFGVAVLNGIVLISYLNQLKEEGINDVQERIIMATAVRFRPILMTAAVASLGFIPMALSGSAGAEVQRPLATVVIGGLFTSTLLTLFVLPVLYAWIEEKKWGGMSRNTAAIVLVFSSLFMAGLASAQAPEPANTSLYTLEKAVSMALQQYPSIQSATLEYDQMKALKGASFSVTKTNVLFNYGQYNSIWKDNSFSVSQGFHLPGYYSSGVHAANERIKSSEIRIDISKRELIRNVRLKFYQLVLLHEKEKLLKYQDSLYTDFNKAAALRFKTGESAYLEKISAETKLMEVQNALFLIRSDIEIAKDQLRKMMVTAGDFDIAYQSPFYRKTNALDTAGLESNPFLAFSRQQVTLNRSETSLERSRLLPELMLGYTNQTLQGNQLINGTDVYFGVSKRFQYLQAGIGIPLFYTANRSRINASKLAEKVAASNYQLQRVQLESEVQQLIRQYQKLDNTIRYYEQKALAHADLLITYSEKSFKLGEVGYFQYIQGITEGLKIKLDYLETIHQINQTTINIEFISGGQL